jgi:hypothetical protein
MEFDLLQDEGAPWTARCRRNSASRRDPIPVALSGVLATSGQHLDSY